jgi:hypothetical protein
MTETTTPLTREEQGRALLHQFYGVEFSRRNPTGPMLNYVVSLASDRVAPSLGSCGEERIENIAAQLEGRPDKWTVSKWIDYLKQQPVDVKDGYAQPQVPAGRYAVYGDDGTVDFYQVDKPEQGRWVGHTFVKLLIGAPGSFNEQRFDKTTAATILRKIETSGVENSARLFGQKTEHCGNCMSPLTQPQSRAAGYGGTCAGKHGYWYPSLAEALRILEEDALLS